MAVTMKIGQSECDFANGLATLQLDLCSWHGMKVAPKVPGQLAASQLLESGVRVTEDVTEPGGYSLY